MISRPLQASRYENNFIDKHNKLQSIENLKQTANWRSELTASYVTDSENEEAI